MQPLELLDKHGGFHATFMRLREHSHREAFSCVPPPSPFVLQAFLSVLFFFNSPLCWPQAGQEHAGDESERVCVTSNCFPRPACVEQGRSAGAGRSRLSFHLCSMNLFNSGSPASDIPSSLAFSERLTKQLLVAAGAALLWLPRRWRDGLWPSGLDCQAPRVSTGPGPRTRK